MITESVEKEYGNRLRLRVAGICIENQKILLVNHSGLNEQNEFWAPPGGGMTFGESAIQCLEREFVEETGLTIKAGDFLGLTEYINHPLHAVELFFRVVKIRGALKTGTDPEVPGKDQIIKNVDFFSFKDLIKIPDTQKHGILKGIKNYGELVQKRGYFKFPQHA